MKRWCDWLRCIVGEVEHWAHHLRRRVCLCHREEVYFVPSVCCLFIWFRSFGGPDIFQSVPILSYCFIECLVFPCCHRREDAMGENVPRSHGLKFRMTTRECCSASSCAQMWGRLFSWKTVLICYHADCHPWVWLWKGEGVGKVVRSFVHGDFHPLLYQARKSRQPGSVHDGA